VAGYDPNPSYPPIEGKVGHGWDTAVATLPGRDLVLAIDGPAILDWPAVVDGLEASLAAVGIRPRLLSTIDFLVPWERTVEQTSTPDLADDPDYARLASADIGAFFQDLVDVHTSGEGTTIVVGPGAALAAHDALWYVDLPKRHAEAAVRRGQGRNLGQRDDGSATTRRLFYIDWPVLDRHREAIASRIDLWIDLQHSRRPTWIDGAALHRTVDDLAKRPFRTRPTFNTAPWGGHWGQRRLGHNMDAANTAIGYELIAPESGVLVGDRDGPWVEVPFQLLVGLRPVDILGSAVHDQFGSSFPIRFDYLDTVDGGSLSIHCHPQLDYMREVFGWPYTQHESYYVMVGGDGAKVFLGLRDGVDLASFERQAHAAVDHSEPFDIEAYVQAFPADRHQLFMIPAGTPHGSGDGNVVLEVSATPYLYSLRFYDWLRRDAEGALRPVPLRHAFANLNHERRGDSIPRELIQEPRTVRSGVGWREESIGSLSEIFYEVRRVVLDTADVVAGEPDERFHVLNVVDGDGVTIEHETGSHPLSYAETLVVPAAVGGYRLRRRGDDPVLVVKALVR
jgi:mannose-6-phosphate isomerase class I